MLANMAKRTKGKPKDYHKGPRESFHMTEELHQELLDYINSQPARPDKSEVLRAALREFLARHRRRQPPPPPA